MARKPPGGFIVNDEVPDISDIPADCSCMWDEFNNKKASGWIRVETLENCPVHGRKLKPGETVVPAETVREVGLKNLAALHEGDKQTDEDWDPTENALEDWEKDLVAAMKDSPDEDLFAQDVNDLLADLGDLLVAKNKAYGDSALHPVRIFSNASPIEQLRVRIDDKLSRIARGTDYGTEDTVDDLLGYLVLYQLALKKEKN